MVNVCQSDPITADSTQQILDGFSIVTTVMDVIFMIISLCGLYIIFIQFRNFTKPLYVKLIWAMATVIVLSYAIIGYLWNSTLKHNIMNRVKNGEKHRFAFRLSLQLFLICDVMTLLIHWTFAR